MQISYSWPAFPCPHPQAQTENIPMLLSQQKITSNGVAKAAVVQDEPENVW